MAAQPATPAARRIAVAGIAVAVAGALTNALGYLVPVIGARQLTAADLSALATVLGLVAIATVPGLGLQIAIAVHRARHGPTRTTRVGLATAAVCAGTLAALAIPLRMVLDLPVPYTLLAAGYTFATVLAGRWLGDLQGDQRFLRLAAGMAILAIGRYAGLIAALVLGADLTWCLVAATASAWLIPPALSVIAIKSEKPAASAARYRVLTACSATLAMLVASYADLLLARHLLHPDDSGAYSVGTVLTKGALWAPQVVSVIALPRLAQHGNTRTLRTALLLVAGWGTVLVAASAVAGRFAMTLAGGPDYAHLAPYAPAFAATGALYALVFVLINAQVAKSARWPSAPLWLACAALVVVAEFLAPHTVPGIMWSAVAAAVIALALTTLMTTRTGTPPTPAPTATTPSTRIAATHPAPAPTPTESSPA